MGSISPCFALQNLKCPKKTCNASLGKMGNIGGFTTNPKGRRTSIILAAKRRWKMQKFNPKIVGENGQHFLGFALQNLNIKMWTKKFLGKNGQHFPCFAQQNKNICNASVGKMGSTGGFHHQPQKQKDLNSKKIEKYKSSILIFGVENGQHLPGCFLNS